MRSKKRICTENRQTKTCCAAPLQVLVAKILPLITLPSLVLLVRGMLPTVFSVAVFSVAVFSAAVCSADDHPGHNTANQASQHEVSTPIAHSTAVQVGQTGGVANQLEATNTPESGFWFLNTHQSAQSFSASGPDFRPDISRYEKGAGYRSSSYSEMLSQLEPGVPVCIMVHGSFVDTLSASRESAYTFHWLRSVAGNQRMQMIYFHWPSFRALSPLIQFDTNQLGRQAARNGFYLADLIAALPANCPVSILGHSHGARITSSALHLMAGGVVQGYTHRSAGTNRRPIRTVFLAGAIDHHWLNPGQRYDRALYSTQGLLNLKNRIDPVLAIYPLRLPLLVRRPIGNLGMTSGDRRRIGPSSQKVLNIEVGKAIGFNHVWPLYFNNQRIAATLRNYVYFPDLAPTPPKFYSSTTSDSSTSKSTAVRNTISHSTVLRSTVSRSTVSRSTAKQSISATPVSQANRSTVTR